MTLGEWIPLWLKYYKAGTMKQGSYHQLELLERRIPDSLKAAALGEILPMHPVKHCPNSNPSFTLSWLI